MPPPRKSAHKIELTGIYPCPCCHQGQLRPITLTEALGCSRCQHIFALMPDHLHIEQLAVSYPYRKLWYWNGSHWSLCREESAPQSMLLGLALGLIVLIALSFIVATQLEGQGELVIWLAIAMIFLLGLLTVLILILRRS
ncbi:MAG: hypothetical protein NW237_11905 [Cyanobacteriota bacterium]|nr:hypothetical protein [Cyanobacteriota bacterium]